MTLAIGQDVTVTWHDQPLTGVVKRIDAERVLVRIKSRQLMTTKWFPMEAGERGMSDLDPRWEWVEMHHLGSAKPEYIRSYCNHLDVVPVESVIDGEVLAHLCRTCDAQLPEEWRP